MITIYGAILSTAVYITNRRKDKGCLRVSLSTSPTAFGALDELPISIEFRAVNCGHRVVSLEPLEAVTTDGKRLVLQYRVNTPLEDGEAHLYRDHIPSLRRCLDSAGPEGQFARVYFTDSEGNKYGTSTFPATMIDDGVAVSSRVHGVLAVLWSRVLRKQ